MADITYQHVTAEWTHLIEDGMVDLDGNPDEVGVTGNVRFIPTIDKSAPAYPTGDPTRSVTLAEIPGIVANGVLEDSQGREGVWLAATIGGRPIQWTAQLNLRHNNTVIKTRDITFMPPESGTELRLNDVAEDPDIDWGGNRPTPRVDINLPTIGDYVYTYTLSTGTFDPDAELFYVFGLDDPTRWDFDIDEDVASIHKVGTAVAEIEAGTRYWLMLKESVTAPTIELQTGIVKKVMF
ncbi:minor tail protein [Gordonia phage BrutonGaster]|uniref:Minor tail protein n=1 Tax=Gordonia phage BrutonGaster TaxID=2530116 RepID=A0A482JKH2_9CAUD|nr:minor tail protein [Gordonia phage BrutonGaster]QBP33263.1 minor tail protein [Gordonia phage BrutonGaster]